MWLIILVGAILLVFYFLKKNNEYWKVRGVPGPEPYLLVGNICPSIIFKKSFGQIISEIYNAYPDLPFVGFYRGLTPGLLIRDPEFIKDITSKNFKCFYNNELEVDKEVDPIMGRNPLVLKGQEWKHVRSQLTPCFTSGKMKFVYPLIEEVGNSMVTYLKKIDKSKPLEAKELCTKYTVDNVASCAFGVNGKCFVEDESEFLILAKEFMNPGSITALKFLLLFMVPPLAKLFSIKFVPSKVDKKMVQLVEETLKHREEHNIVRNDFLHMMNQLMKSNPDFTMIDIVGHAAGFIADGFETSSIVMSFVLYEIAGHPDVQEKLRDEIETILENHNGNMTYEAIMEMDYLNAVILESLRRNPPVFVLSKRCTEKFTYQTSEDSDFKKMSITIEPGMCMILPIAASAGDEKFFPNAKTYDPERFAGENKNDYNKYTFMPFGEGPRQCLGQRFGLLQTKVGVATIVKNFKISVNNKTKEPIQVDPAYFLLKPVGGLWLDFEEIKK